MGMSSREAVINLKWVVSVIIMTFNPKRVRKLIMHPKITFLAVPVEHQHYLSLRKYS